MELFTKAELPRSGIKIDYTRKLAFFGSCFADNISSKFESRKFAVLANPFGTVYNPVSIARLLRDLADEKVYGEADVFEDRRCGGLWHCWGAHGSLSAPTREGCIEKLNRASASAREFLKQADTVFVTLGSSFVYTLKETGEVVANCHRQDPALFDRRRISVGEAARSIREIASSLWEIQKDCAIVFTVSPIRHLGDGTHGNNLSKATLLLATDEAIRELSSEGSPRTEYFPSYEIAMDELRDYRFYESDMVHLSGTAEEIIFERMVETYCDKATGENIVRVEKFMKGANHRIQDSSAPATQEFLKKLKEQAKVLELQIPGLRLNIG